MNPTLRFVLWLLACICWALATLGVTIGKRNLTAAGLLCGGLTFLIEAANVV